MRQLSEKDLIRGVQDGRADSAEYVCRQLRPVIERTIRRVFPDCDDHDDLVQTALERVIRSLTDGRFYGTCSLSTWAASIAAHVGTDAVRTRSRERGLFRAELASSPDSFDAPELVPLERRLEARSELSCLKRELAGMTAEQRQTLLLHDVLGLELDDIASKTGVTPAAAQSRLVRGRRELIRRRTARRSLESMTDE